MPMHHGASQGGQPLAPSGKGGRNRQVVVGGRKRRAPEGGKAQGGRVSAALQAHRAALPVAAFERKIVEAVQSHAAVIVVGETGSGKTTQVPQFLLQGLTCTSRAPRLVVTQPRRVAAITVAERVAAEMGAEVPAPRGEDEPSQLDGGRASHPVGYRVRFADATRRDTRCVFATDGMLLREAQVSPSLPAYDVVLLDEAHERGLNTDVLFAVIKRAMAARAHTKSPLRVVVMSATLDVAKFAEYFGAHSITVPGRQHPVATHYLAAPVAEPVDAAVSAVLQLHIDAATQAMRGMVAKAWGRDGHDGARAVPLPPCEELGELGDVLVFLAGRDDIETSHRLLEDRWASLEAAWVSAVRGALAEGGAASHLSQAHGDAVHSLASALPRLHIVQLYAALSPAKQRAAFAPAPPGHRKVILSTNIAETSITIPGIRTVIDTGYVKVRTHRPGAVADTLLPEPVSQAQAAQRKGRAGREAPGQVYRLFTERAYDSMQAQPIPEVLRVDLASTALSLGCMGETAVSLARFPWLDAPSREGLRGALCTLVQLRAMASSVHDGGSQDGQVTPVGRAMGAMPLPPILAALVLQAGRLSCAVEAITLAALLSLDGPLWSALPEAAASDAAVVASKRKRKKFHSSEGDHVTMLNAWAGFERMVWEVASAPPSVPTGDLALPQLSASQWKLVREWCAAHSLQLRSLRRAADIRQQLAALALKQDLLGGAEAGLPFQPAWASAIAGRSLYSDSEVLRRALVASGFMQVAFLAPGAAQAGSKRTRPQYVTAVGRKDAWIHPSSVLFGAQPHPPAVLYSELVFTRKTFMRVVSAIEPAWLPTEAGHAFRMKGAGGVANAMH